MSEKNNTASLGWGTRISYGLGDTACNIVFGMITALLTLFYTDYCGIPVVTVGLVMLISRIFDGSSDVIMGIIVSKTKSKWGKARPWILWMSVPYVLCAVAMFCVPHSSSTTVQFWYIFVTYNLCTTVCYTAINVPYGTLSTMMTRSSHERDLLSVVRMSLSPIGKIIAVTFTMPVIKLFGNDQAAWIKTMSIWCAIALALLVICFVRCKETVNFEAAQQEQPKVPASRALKALLGNPYFWATLVLWTVTCVHTTIIGTDLPYYCKYVLGNDEWYYSVIYTSEIVALIVGALLSNAAAEIQQAQPVARRLYRSCYRPCTHYGKPDELPVDSGNDHHPLARSGSADLSGIRHDGRRCRVRSVEEPSASGKPDLRRRFARL